MTPETFRLDPCFAAGFLHTRVGLFDPYLPVEGAPAVDELAVHRKLVLSVLDVERQWLTWLEPGEVDVEALLADLERLRSWIESWKLDALAREVAAGKRETLEALRAKPALLDASERLAPYMGTRIARALKRPTPLRESPILVPDRGRFVEPGCLSGSVSPFLRVACWRTDLIHRVESVLGPCQLQAPELLDPGRGKQDWRGSDEPGRGAPATYRPLANRRCGDPPPRPGGLRCRAAPIRCTARGAAGPRFPSPRSPWSREGVSGTALQTGGGDSARLRGPPADPGPSFPLATATDPGPPFAAGL